MSDQLSPVPLDPASVPAPASDKKGLAIAGFVLSILNLFPWIFAFCGTPFAFVGLVLSILGLKSSLRTLAIIGAILSGISFTLVIIETIAGFMPGSGGIFRWIQSILGYQGY